MKFSDVLRMAIHNLSRRRMRTALNLIGIVIGCTMLLMTAAGGSGVSVALRGLLDSSDYAKQISVHSSFHHDFEVPDEFTRVEGEMSDERRERLKVVMADKWREENVPWTSRHLKPELLDRFESLPHVVEVVPDSWARGVVAPNRESILTAIEGCSASDRDIADRVIAGKTLSRNDGDEILIHEYLAYRLGYRSDQQLMDLVGRDIQVTLGTAKMQLGGLIWSMNDGGGFDGESFEKQLRLAAAFTALMQDLDSTSLDEQQKELLTEAMTALQGPRANGRDETGHSDPADTEVAKTETFRVAGIVRTASYSDPWALFRQAMHGGSGDALVGYRTARRLQELRGDDLSFYQARVTVDSIANLADTVAVLEAEGVRTSSALQILENVDREIARITWVIYGIAGGILLIACLGISNTLIISVMERTPEFGIMKSLGARDSHILLLTITEGAFLGGIGAAVSFLVSWLLALAGDGILKSYVESRVAEELQSGLFSFSPVWVAGVAAVSILVCMLASLLPAWRASRLDPVVAMRRT